MFLAAIGDDALKVYNTFEYSSAAESKNLTVIVNKFKSNCTPQKNVIFFDAKGMLSAMISSGTPCRANTDLILVITEDAVLSCRIDISGYLL